MKPNHRPDCSCCLFWTDGQEEAEFTPSGPSLCDYCGAELHVGDYPFCRGNPAVHERWRRHTFVPVEVDLGKDGKHRISSIQDADRLERESERRAANGEGQQIAFRAFNNDPSNQDRNSLGENPSGSVWRGQYGEHKYSSRTRRGLPRIIKRGG